MERSPYDELLFPFPLPTESYILEPWPFPPTFFHSEYKFDGKFVFPIIPLLTIMLLQIFAQLSWQLSSTCLVVSCRVVSVRVVYKNIANPMLYSFDEIELSNLNCEGKSWSKSAPVPNFQAVKLESCWKGRLHADCKILVLNSLWPGDAIWRPGTRSTWAQVMASCLTAPSNYLNQC